MNRVRIGLLVAAAAIVGVPALASAQDASSHQERHAGGERGPRPTPPPVQDRRTMPAPQPQQQQHAAPALRPAEPPRPPEAQRPAGGAPGYAQQRMRDAGRPYVGGGDPASRRWMGQPQQAQRPQQAAQAPADQARRFAGSDGRQGDDRRGDDRPGDDRRGDDRRVNDGRGPDRRPGGDARFQQGQYGRPQGQNPGWRGDDRGRNWSRPGNDGRQGWRADWRGDHRYDWQGWRARNRSLFHVPRYAPPRGYGLGYRSFSLGYRLDPFFFAPEYWIDDPWEYRLPPVYGPYRWVRYYNDVLLVDIDTGEVVDVIHNFFW